MAQHIGAVTVLVRDYEDAKAYYVDTLGFDVVEDVPLEEGKRWLIVRPPGSTGTGLLLARALGSGQAAKLGDQAGGRVFLFLHTDDFWSDYRKLSRNGVMFKEMPRQEAYGTVAVFEDLYGNLWDLLQLRSGPGPTH